MTLRERLVQGLREPLVQFLLAGAAIFIVFALAGGGPDPGERRIAVDEARVQRIVTLWMQTWHRPPTPAELDGLIGEYVQEEVYYREALRLGLDRDDPVIRRRLRSKMEFLAADQLESVTPADDVLKAWMQAHPALYVPDAKLSFQQIYVGSATDRDAAEARAATILSRLAAGASPAQLRQPLSLPTALSGAFGEAFSAGLLRAPIGRWTGPVASGFGLHVVKVTAVKLGPPPALDQVRQAVENDWRAATRAEREAKAYQDLLKGYDVVIARPE
jgi:peptidyl-prolyl cis-trans isomerase C